MVQKSMFFPDFSPTLSTFILRKTLKSPLEGVEAMTGERSEEQEVVFVFKGDGDTGPGVDSGDGEGDEERDHKACLQYARPDECSLLPNFSPSFCLL